MPFGGILGAEPEKQVIQEIWIFAQVSLCLPKHTLLPFSKKNSTSLQFSWVFLENHRRWHWLTLRKSQAGDVYQSDERN